MGLIITLPSFLVRREYFEVLDRKVLEAHCLYINNCCMCLALKVVPDVLASDQNRFLGSEPSLSFSSQKEFLSLYTAYQGLALHLVVGTSASYTRLCAPQARYCPTHLCFWVCTQHMPIEWNEWAARLMLRWKVMVLVFVAILLLFGVEKKHLA